MVTVKDIAKVAGVSVSTVSRALSAPERVAPEKRALVQQIAEDMGYRANKAARGLITGETTNLGLLVPDLENPVYAAVAKGAQSKARSMDYSVFIGDSDEDADFELNFVESMSRQVDGIILCSPRMSEEKLREVAQKIPLMLVNREASGIPSVAVDNFDGMRQGLLHLYALGHRKIAYVGGPSLSWTNAQRLKGLQESVAELADVELEVFDNLPPVFSGGVAIADQVAASGSTGILCHNDLMALGILNRLGARGISVPDEISIVGFDDIPPAMLASPQLTTIGASLRQLGHQAVERLVPFIKAEDDPALAHRIPVHLVVRESSMDRKP